MTKKPILIAEKRRVVIVKNSSHYDRPVVKVQEYELKGKSPIVEDFKKLDKPLFLRRDYRDE